MFPWYGSAIGQILVVSVVSAKSSKVSAKWVVGLVLSAKALKPQSGSPSVGQSGRSLPRPYRYTCPPSSRADMLDVFDEFVMMGVGQPPVNMRSFHFSRYDMTRRRDMTSDGAM